MQGKERSAVLSLAAIMAFRMLGLFMILPVFSVRAEGLVGASTTMVGLALGIYGLTQAILQMPFGALSDRIGRKPIIATGLVLFTLGSVVAAMSTSIYGIILGRALQGAGAIGSTTLALIADLTRDENRSKAMASVGLTIGAAFTLAMILGPIVNSWFHLSGIFWLTAIFACLGLVLLFTTVPTPPKLAIHHDDIEISSNRFFQVIRNPQLLRLDFGIFSLHTILTAMFIAIPIMLTRMAGLTELQQVVLYLIVLSLAFICVVPLIIVSEKKRKLKPIFIAAIAMVLLAQILLMFFHFTPVRIGVILFLFFCAFTLLEASLPSLISKVSPIRSKGTAMGVYSTAQFFGIFVGGWLGGRVYTSFHLTGLFVFCALIALAWIFVAITMSQPPYLSTLIMSLPSDSSQDATQLVHRLRSIPGVAEVALMIEEEQVYMKIDKKIVSEHELRDVIKHSNVAD